MPSPPDLSRWPPIKNSKQLRMATLMAQVLDFRLRSLASQGVSGLQEIASLLELPLYPDLNLTWLAIQFRCLYGDSDDGVSTTTGWRPPSPADVNPLAGPSHFDDSRMAA
ncbi:MAG: hypothetical protein LLG04_17100 [Parachlamydia sp.]|nr:hypothetical protein [Parachlamydia sp.]